MHMYTYRYLNIYTYLKRYIWNIYNVQLEIRSLEQNNSKGIFFFVAHHQGLLYSFVGYTTTILGNMRTYLYDYIESIRNNKSDLHFF